MPVTVSHGPGRTNRDLTVTQGDSASNRPPPQPRTAAAAASASDSELYYVTEVDSITGVTDSEAGSASVESVLTLSR